MPILSRKQLIAALHKVSSNKNALNRYSNANILKIGGTASERARPVVIGNKVYQFNGNVRKQIVNHANLVREVFYNSLENYRARGNNSVNRRPTFSYWPNRQVFLRNERSFDPSNYNWSRNVRSQIRAPRRTYKLASTLYNNKGKVTYYITKDFAVLGKKKYPYKTPKNVAAFKLILQSR